RPQQQQHLREPTQSATTSMQPARGCDGVLEAVISGAHSLGPETLLAVINHLDQKQQTALLHASKHGSVL
ncbi:hypothetical protein HaLaN_03423, partial [Haematococcus lacustris]